MPPPSTNGHTSREASTIDQGRRALVAWPVMRVAFVAREFYPFIGGGIAPIVAAAARQLSDAAEVTVVTSASHREEYERLRARGDPRLPPASVRMVFVEEPDSQDWGAFMSYMHSYSARVDRALRDAFPGRGPDLIEFCDYLAEGFVTIQARAHAGIRWLRGHARMRSAAHDRGARARCSTGTSPDDFDDDRRPATPSATACATPTRCSGRAATCSAPTSGSTAPMPSRPAVKLPDAFLNEDEPRRRRPHAPADGDALQLLYLGRLERRKGVQNLVRAVTALERDDWPLTLVGGDTDTAPLGGSMRPQLELMAAGDPRIRSSTACRATRSAGSSGSLTLIVSRRCGSAGRTPRARR